MGVLCGRPEREEFPDEEVNLFQFKLLKCVGKGSFGKVKVVKHKQTQDLYALKYISKAKCIRLRVVEHLIRERKLLEEIDHPFVVNLRYAFQDDKNCFFVLDLMLGGDLRFHIQKMQYLPEAAVRLYVAEIGSALSFIHTMGIIHRDIKPDNVLLDIRGHAHLTDFNIATRLSSEHRVVVGVAGSMAYIAPEVLSKKGYRTSVDWWSLGVCAYECIFGFRPFRDSTSEAALHQSICKDPVRFPSEEKIKCSLDGKSALKSLLNRDVHARMGCRQGIKDLQAHPWFKPIDFDILDLKEIVPPYLPDQKHENFDMSYELEELLLEDDPLKARKRRAKDLNSLSAEKRRMEEEFTNFDFTQVKDRAQIPHTAQESLMSQATAATSTAFGGSRPVTPAMTAKEKDGERSQLQSMEEIEEIPAISLEDMAHNDPGRPPTF